MWQMTPLEDYIIVERHRPSERTVGGLWIPEAVQDGKTHLATVLEVGPGRTTDDGQLIPMVVKKGQTVLIGKYVGSHIWPNGEGRDPQWLAIREDDVVAIVSGVENVEPTNGHVIATLEEMVAALPEGIG